MTFPSISLIIPYYNEAERIDLMFEGIGEFADKWAGDYEIILVDDGSNDGSERLINEHRVYQRIMKEQRITLLQQPNSGKGGALKLGVANATKDHILTLDADMATYPIELKNWLELKHTFRSDELLIGSRELEQSVIHEVLMRKWIGNIFNYLIRKTVGLPFRDTQCGFKLYPAVIAKEVFSQLTTFGWSHDVEILLRVLRSGYSVVEMPVNWTAVKGSKIRVIKDSWIMFWEVVKIRKDLGIRHKP